MESSTRVLSAFLSEYITARDNYITRYKHRNTGLFAPGTVGGPMGFNSLLIAFGNRFAALMPPHMTIAQWEALSELASSHLAELRKQQ